MGAGEGELLYALSTICLFSCVPLGVCWHCTLLASFVYSFAVHSVVVVCLVDICILLN